MSFGVAAPCTPRSATCALLSRLDRMPRSANQGPPGSREAPGVRRLMCKTAFRQDNPAWNCAAHDCATVG
eukprot:4650689-Alexandrium_andersonii.AAC.1